MPAQTSKLLLTTRLKKILLAKLQAEFPGLTFDIARAGGAYEYL